MLQGRYAGLISVADAHLATAGTAAAPMPLAQLFRASKTVLRPELNIKEAAELFERTESEALVVVDDLASLKPDRLAHRGACAAPLYRGAGARAERSCWRTLARRGLAQTRMTAKIGRTTERVESMRELYRNECGRLFTSRLGHPFLRSDAAGKINARRRSVTGRLRCAPLRMVRLVPRVADR